MPNPHLYGVVPFRKDVSGHPITNSSQLDKAVVMGPVAVLETTGVSPSTLDVGCPGVIAPLTKSTSDADPPLARFYSSVRSVSGGIRLSSDSASTVNNARIWACQVPLQQPHVPWNVLTGNNPGGSPFLGLTAGTTTDELIRVFTGIQPTSTPYSGSPSMNNIGSSIMSMPGVMTLTGNEIILRDAEFHFTPQTPDCYRFLDTETVGEQRVYNFDRTTYEDFADYAGVTSTGNAIPSAQAKYNNDSMDFSGWNGILVTIVAPDDDTVFNLDYVLHGEGVSNLTNTNGSQNYTQTGSSRDNDSGIPSETLVSYAKKMSPWFDLALKGMNEFMSNKDLQDLTRGILRIEL